MTQRPAIAPDVLAAIITSAPERLQKKLDRDPRAADAWEWTEANGQWTVNAGEETVCIPSGLVGEVAQVKCSCLLSPRCFHVLAVLSVAEIAEAIDASSLSAASSVDDAESGPGSDIQSRTENTEEPSENDLRPLTNVQHHATRMMFEATAAILASGLRAAGVQLQSRLLRAIHECRSEGLHRIAAGGLRIMNNLRQLRGGEDEFSSAAAEADFREVLESCVRLSRAASVGLEWIGVARREFQPVNSLKLHALFCEPILTRSGYSGVVTWLISDDGWIGTVSDVQPGDAKRIPQAWQSGVTLAGLSISHRDLSHKCLLISKATRSVDGRLGGGESARAIAIDGQGWNASAIASKFQIPLSDQIRSAFRRQTGSDFLQPAGTDFVFFSAIVGGYSGQELIVQEYQSETILRLAIAIDDDGVAFRSSLQMLSRAPGLALRIIGRIDFTAAGRIYPLAIAPLENPASEDDAEADRPSLVLPAPLQVVSIGLHEVTRSHLSRAESQAVPVMVGSNDDTSLPIAHYDDCLERWLRAITIGGRHAIPQGLVTNAVRDAARLKSQLRPAASSLLHSLTQSTIATKTELSGIRFCESPNTLATKWLAASISSLASKQHLQLREWMRRIDRD